MSTPPLRVLILGGSRFIGSHLVECAKANGHQVWLHNRGLSRSGEIEGVTQVRGDRDGDLDELTGLDWDVTFDLSGYVPSQVRRFLSAVGPRAGHYVFVSSTAAYAAPQRYGFVESDALVGTRDLVSEEVTDETYGPLKVACEDVVRELAPDSCIVRPTYVVGPGDYSGRFTYWLQRAAAGGTILAPGPDTAYFQWIDVQDLVPWMVGLAERRVTGAYHAANPFPPTTFGDVLRLVVEELAPPNTTLDWVDAGFLLERGIVGDVLPMWPGANPEGIVEAADPTAAIRTGLQLRSLQRTIQELAAYDTQHPIDQVTPVGSNEPYSVGLTTDLEASLLQQWHSRE